jgi:hypothetical protein
MTLYGHAWRRMSFETRAARKDRARPLLAN